MRYTAASGARVFAASSLHFNFALDGWRYGSPDVGPTSPKLQAFMRNVLGDMLGLAPAPAPPIPAPTPPPVTAPPPVAPPAVAAPGSSAPAARPKAKPVRISFARATRTGRLARVRMRTTRPARQRAWVVRCRAKKCRVVVRPKAVRRGRVTLRLPRRTAGLRVVVSVKVAGRPTVRRVLPIRRR